MTFSASPPLRGLPVLGYTTRRHLILDLDNTSAEYASRIASQIMKAYPKVGDCLLLRTSEKPDRVRIIYNKWGRPLVKHDRHNFHLVFDNGIGYNACCRICETLAELGILNRDYVKIRKFRGDMTLRVSEAHLMNEVKPMPRVRWTMFNTHTYRRDGYIDHYLEFKKNAERGLFALADTVHVADYGRNGPDRE